MAAPISSRKVRLAGAALLATVGLAIYLAVTAIQGVPLYPYKYVTARFATAANLAPHDDVRVAGARVGQIASITYRSGVAVVRMQIQPSTKVYSNASASVGAVSALGTEFVALDPGTASAGPIRAAGIQLSRTTTPVEIDQVLNILKPNVRDAAAAMLQTLGEGIGGHGQDLNELLGNAPSLLPNLATTASALSSPQTQLVTLMGDARLLATRFQDMTGQLSALVVQADSTLNAIDAQGGQALAATIQDASPALRSLTPALTDLSSVAGTAGAAVAQLRPGLAALGSATPDLRAVMVQGVPPLLQVPPVARQSLPALAALTLTLAQAQHPVIPFLAQLEQAADPLLTYLAPYAGDLVLLEDNLNNSMTQGDANAHWMRVSLLQTDPGQFTGTNAGVECRDPYAPPNHVGMDSGTPLSGGCK